MAMNKSIYAASDRVMAALVSGLEIEFGQGAGEVLAQHFLEAEEIDFIWEVRIEERWIGAFESIEEAEQELDRIEILGRLDGRWFVAMMIVDGDGKVHGMIGKRTYESERAARMACVWS